MQTICSDCVLGEYLPLLVEIDNAVGKQLVSASTILTAFFAIYTLVLYNFRSLTLTRGHREVLVSLWDRVFVTLYVFIAILFEVELNYGAKLNNYGDWHGPSFIVLLTWISCNMLSMIFLSCACCFSVRYRLFIYVPLCLHALASTVIFTEMVARPHFGFDIIVPVVMATITTGLVFKAPLVFQIDANRYKFELNNAKKSKHEENLLNKDEVEMK